MPRIIEADYDQIHLLPPSLEEWVGPEHPARFVREFVGQLDLEALGFTQPAEGEQGRPAYGTALMTRIWVYAYLEKVRSFRKVEAACRERMGFIWLCGNQGPDHNSLWRFWKANRRALGKLFKQSVKVAMELELVGLVLQAVDGTKIQAASSGRGPCDEAELKRAVERLDEIIAGREKELEEARGMESEELRRREEELGEKELKVERLRAALEKVQAGEARHIHPQEPEARRMKAEGRNAFSYNAQAVVDEKAQIIVAAEVVNEPNDLGQLSGMLAEAEQSQGAKPEATLADGGYVCGRELAQVQAAGHEVLAPPPGQRHRAKGDPYHASCFLYERESDEVICPQGRRLPFRRERQRRGVSIREYRSAAVCADCPVREHCTSDRHGRSIEIGPWDEPMRAHRRKMQKASNIERLKKRAHIVEPVFGWIKSQWEFRRWSGRGLENARAQWAMVATACNLRTIYRHWVTAA